MLVPMRIVIGYIALGVFVGSWCFLIWSATHVGGFPPDIRPAVWVMLASALARGIVAPKRGRWRRRLGLWPLFRAP